MRRVDGEVLTDKDVKRRWLEYFERLLNMLDVKEVGMVYFRTR